MAEFVVFRNDGSTEVWQGEGYATTHILLTNTDSGKQESYTAGEFLSPASSSGERFVYLIAYYTRPDDEVIHKAIIKHETKPVEMRK
ncbi:hypothetical protein C1N58_12665 [Pantoea sp. SGAir0180]